MPKCVHCGKEFDLSTVRRIMGKRYGAGIYNDYYPNGDVCEDCATEVIGADYATGQEVMELMGDSWFDD